MNDLATILAGMAVGEARRLPVAEGITVRVSRQADSYRYNFRSPGRLAPLMGKHQTTDATKLIWWVGIIAGERAS